MRHVMRIQTVALLTVVAAPAGLLARQAESGEKIYQQGLKSTVWVVVPLGRGGLVSSGTGSLVNLKRKVILTNYHVVGKKDVAFVFFPKIVKGEVVLDRDTYVKNLNTLGVRGKVIARDSTKDLALIQLEGDVPKHAKEIHFAARSPGPAQRLHSIGNPGTSGALWAYTPGTVRQVYHKKWHLGGEDPFDVDAKIVETDSPVNEGDSGGPAFNDRGELVAVTQGHLSDSRARLVSIFIDISEVKTFLTKHHVPLPAPAPTQVAPPAVATSDVRPMPSPEDDKTKMEKEAARKLKLAKQLLDDGIRDKARTRLKELADSYPKTKAGEEARELLKQFK